MQNTSEFAIGKVLGLVGRRKSLIATVSIVVFLLSGYLAWTLPNVYESKTVILITPQKLPANYIHSTVTSNIHQRIRTIIEQILTRSKLEEIITEHNLFPADTADVSMEDRVQQLRKRVRTEIRRNDTIQLSFEAESSETAMRVTSRLATLFIGENLEVREQQARGTTAFINAEADRLRKELEEQEAKVNHYRTRYRNELPDQLDANLRTVEQLRAELQGNITRLASLGERKASLEQQIAEGEWSLPPLGSSASSSRGVGQNSPRSELENQRMQLIGLLQRYSEKHPDVIRLKREIEILETKVPAQAVTTNDGPTSVSQSNVNPFRKTLIAQLQNINSEIAALGKSNDEVKTQIVNYQSRTDNAPIRGNELSKISRDYNITLKKYQDLMAKSLDSQLSENMEKTQKGEQFRIIEPASFPERPVRPDRLRTLLIGLLAGLGLGFGLAFVLENLDTSFKNADELAAYVDVPILGSIPGVTARASVLARRQAHVGLVLASIGVLYLGVVLIRLFGPSLNFL